MQIVHMGLLMARSWLVPAPRGAGIFYFVAFFSALAFGSGLFPSPAAAQYNNICMRERGHMDDQTIEACDVAVALCMTAGAFTKSGVSDAERRARIDDCINKSIRTGNSPSQRSATVSPSQSDQAPLKPNPRWPHLTHWKAGSQSDQTASNDPTQARDALEACSTHPSVETCTEAAQSESLSAAERSRAYAWRALARAEHDNLDTSGLAILDCEQAITLDPNDGLAFFLRGGIYSSRYMQHTRDTKLFSLAIGDFDHAFALGLPDEVRPMAYQMRAETYEMAAIGEWREPQSQSDHFRKSLANFSEAIRLDPGNAKLYAKRAFVEKMLGDKQASLDDAHTAKRIDPSIDTDP